MQGNIYISYGFKQLIGSATRFGELHTRTLSDHVVINLNSNELVSGVGACDASDHDIIHAGNKNFLAFSRQLPRSHFTNLQALEAELRQHSWDFPRYNCIPSKYSHFVASLRNITEENISTFQQKIPASF